MSFDWRKNGAGNLRNNRVLFDSRFLHEGHIGSGSSFLAFDSSVGVEVEAEDDDEGV